MKLYVVFASLSSSSSIVIFFITFAPPGDPGHLQGGLGQVEGQHQGGGHFEGAHTHGCIEIIQLYSFMISGTESSASNRLN